MIKLIMAPVSMTAALPTVIIAIILAYLFEFIDITIGIKLIIALAIIFVIISFFRLFVKKERKNKKSIQHTLTRRISKKQKTKLKETLQKLNDRSFISGHVARAAAIGFSYYLLTNEYLWTIILLLWALVVGLARVRLEKHDLSDVTLGFALGLIAAYIAFSIIIF